MPPSRYPKATWKGDGVSGGTYTSGPWKVVLHTTETAGMPGYNSGRSAPHLTYYPRYRKFYQHSTLTGTAARALRNESGGVQTNRDSAIQLEIIAYSNEPMVDRYGGTRIKVSQLTEAHLGDIREFLLWCHREFGVAMKWPGKQARSYSQANASGFRMSGRTWDNYDGVCGHQHVPENTHWDPGAIDWGALMGTGTGTTTTTTETNYMFPIRRGDGSSSQRPERNQDIQHYQAKLKDLGIDGGSDGIADQDFLDAIFKIVGSSLGGSYFSGEEGAKFDRIYALHLAEGMSPTEQAAVAHMVEALASRREDEPSWGGYFYDEYKALWGSAPGPKAPVSHLQLGFVWNKLNRLIEAKEGTTVAEVITAIKERL